VGTQIFSLSNTCGILIVLFPSGLVRQLHREFLRAGADVIQAFTFSLDDDLGGDHAKYGVRNYIYISFDSAEPQNSQITIDGHNL